tara:strand:- start:190 stop:612 length:423 start_codon:yes stop_codon:yes gene_type:complete
MKNYISQNIKYLCDKEKLSQNEFGELFGLGKSVVSMYISEKSTPKLETLMLICEYFKISLDDFINHDLSKLQKIEYGHYHNDPLIGLMTQEPSGSFQSAGYVNMINELRSRIEDKDRIISMLEAEVKRLKGGKDYNSKTA